MLKVNKVVLASGLLLLGCHTAYSRPIRGSAMATLEEGQRKLQNDKNVETPVEEEEDKDAGDEPDVVDEEEDKDAGDEPEDPTQSILDIATGSDDFSTVVSALEAADLVGALGGEGPLTVLAPTNAAFEDADIGFLLEPEWSKHLQSLLLYHVAEGSFLSTEVEMGDEINTLFDNQAWNVTSVDGVFSINDVEVVGADNIATNGVVHVINEVLMPEFTDFTILDLASSSDDFSILTSLLEQTGLAETLNGDAPFTVFAPTNEAVSTKLCCLVEPSCFMFSRLFLV